MAIDPSMAVREGQQLQLFGESLFGTGLDPKEFPLSPYETGQVDLPAPVQVAAGEGVVSKITQAILRPLVGARVSQVGRAYNALQSAAEKAELDRLKLVAEQFDNLRNNAPALTPDTSEPGQNVFITDPAAFGEEINRVGMIVSSNEEGMAGVEFTDPSTGGTQIKELPLSSLHAAPLEIIGEDANLASARQFFSDLEGQGLSDFISDMENKPPELVKVKTGKTRKVVDKDGNVRETDIHRHAYRFAMPSDEVGDATLEAIHDPLRSQELYDSFSAFNPATMDTTPNVLALIEQQALNYEGLIDVQKRGVVNFKAQREVANILGTDQQSLAKALLNRQPGDLGGWTPERTLAARDFMIGATEYLDSLGRRALNGTDADLLQFRQFMSFHGAMQASVLGIRSEAGRLLGSMRQQATSRAVDKSLNIPGEFVDVQGQNIPESSMGRLEIHNNLEQYGGVGAVRDQLDAYMKSTTLSHRAGTVREIERRHWVPAALDAFYESWINFLFSGPQSHIKNLTGTFYTTFAQVPERYAAGTVGKALRKGLTQFGMSQEGVDEVFAEEAQDMLYAFFMTQKEALKAGALTVRTGEQPIAGSRFEIYGAPGPLGTQASRSKAWSAEAFGATGLMGNIIEMSGHLFTLGRIPTKMLSAEDIYFKVLAQRMELHAQAARLSRRLGLTGDDRVDFMAAFITNPRSGEWGNYKFAELGGGEIFKKTHDIARYTALQRELGEVGKSIRMIGRMPVLRYFLPVITTPINSFLYGVRDRSPFALMSKEWRQTIANGGAEADLALGRLSYGTAIIGVAAMMTWMGLMNGAGPADPKERRAWRMKGGKPFSVKIGDKNMTYRWFEPLATQIGVGVDIPSSMVEAGKYAYQDIREILRNDDNTVGADMARIATMAEMVSTGHVSEDDWKAFVAEMALHLAQNVTSATYMSGFSRVLHAIDDPQRYGAQALEGIARTLVPRVLGTAAYAADKLPVRRRVDGLIQAVQSQIPGYREGLRPEIDFLGRMTPMKVMGGDTFWNRWLNPLHYSWRDEEEPIVNAMQLWRATPSDWPEQFQGVTLSDDQIYYTRIWAGDMFREMGNAYVEGRTARFEVLLSPGEEDFIQQTMEVGPATGKSYEELAALRSDEGIKSDLQRIRDSAWQQAIAKLQDHETNSGEHSWEMLDKAMDLKVMRKWKQGASAELIDLSQSDERIKNSLVRQGLIAKEY